MNPTELTHQLIPHENSAVVSTATRYAPANIALCKYWGKRDQTLKLPQTGSLSISLGRHGTHCTIAPAEADSLVINDKHICPTDKVFRRFFAFLDCMRPPQTRLYVQTVNTIPMAAGLASSASAFAAATLTMNDLFGWNADLKTLSILARMGSGSASRSVYEGFVEWLPGERADGLDSYAVPLAPAWPELRIGILTVSDQPKPIGSTEAMHRTVDTAALYSSWPLQVKRDLAALKEAIVEHDMDTLGRHAEHNAMAMHATMTATWPPVIYWLPETVEALHQIHALRESGTQVYATMDAGPNVKLLFPVSEESAVRKAFPSLSIVEP